MIKKILVSLLLLIMACVLLSACSVNHFVAKDYPDYLQNNIGRITGIELNRQAAYTISENTFAHRVEFRSFRAGNRHLWIVEFGKILDMTLKSADYSSLFTPNNASELKVNFDLQRYEFKNFQAYLTLKIDVVDGETNVLSKSYNAVGKNQAAKVIFTRSLGMKNAIQQSTKLAIDELLSEFCKDLKIKNIAIVQSI